MSEFKYLSCVFDKSGTGEADYRRVVTSERKVADLLDPGLRLGACSFSVLGSWMRHFS